MTVATDALVLNIRDLGRVGTWPRDIRRIDRRTPYGNPFPIKGELMPWLALALGQRADEPGRRAAAVLAYRAWITGARLPIPSELPDDAGGEIEYSDGKVRKISDIVVGMGVLMLSRGGAAIAVPPKPDLEPLRGFRLACWCAPALCHGDVIAEQLYGIVVPGLAALIGERAMEPA